jgi:hypothetical protein
MAKAVILYDDKIPGAILSGAATAGGLPLANLQDPQPRKVARWIGTSGHVVADFGAAVPVGLVAISGTNLTAAATIRVRLSTADATGAAGDAHDSGVVAAAADPAFNGAAFRYLSADVVARYLRVDLADATRSWIDAGLLLAGPAFRPWRNYSFGYTLGYQDFGLNEKSPVGITFTSERARVRAAALRFEFATSAEAMGPHTELSRLCGVTRNVAVIPDPDGAYRSAQAIVGTLDDVLPVSHAAFNVWSRTLSIVERI